MTSVDIYGKSYGAMDAENRGLISERTLAKQLKVSCADIRAELRYAEWHHTTTRGGKVLMESYYPEVSDCAIEKIKENAKKRRAKKEKKEITTCTCGCKRWNYNWKNGRLFVTCKRCSKNMWDVFHK